MYKIENTYTNGTGITFDGLRVIHVEKLNDLPQGENLVYTEIDDDNYYFDYESRINDGVMINRSLLDKKKAFRIYKDWPQAWHYVKRDDNLVYKLQQKQKNVKLTDFPTGIVVVDNIPLDYVKNGIPKVVGQEIPFYDNSVTLGTYFSTHKNINYIKIYLEILKIMSELLQNDIYYSDIHQDNFVINSENGDIRLIDFEPFNVIVDNIGAYECTNLLKLLKNLYIRLSELGKFKLSNDFSLVSTYGELDELLNEELQKIKH